MTDSEVRETLSRLRRLIRDVPDFPKPGIVFKDITTLIKGAGDLQAIVDLFVHRFEGESIDKVVGIESRGFIFGAPLACALRSGFVLARKPGKLPADTISETYDLEYGTDSMEIHRDAITAGERVLIVDDLIATGGTAEATMALVRRLDGVVAAVALVVELTFLGGRKRLGDVEVHSLLTY